MMQCFIFQCVPNKYINEKDQCCPTSLKAMLIHVKVCQLLCTSVSECLMVLMSLVPSLFWPVDCKTVIWYFQTIYLFC